MDDDEVFGGNGLAPNPSEVFLAAISGSLQAASQYAANHESIFAMQPFEYEQLAIVMNGELDFRQVVEGSKFYNIHAQMMLTTEETIDRCKLFHKLVEEGSPLAQLLKVAR